MSIRAIRWAFETFEIFDLPPQERSVLVAICYHHHDKTGECFPSYETISAITGYSRRRVIYAVDSLRKCGLISTRKRRTGNRQGSNHFELFGAARVQRAALSNGLVRGASGCTKRHPEGGGFRVQTSAPDKENPMSREDRGGNVVDFSSQKFASGGKV